MTTQKKSPPVLVFRVPANAEGKAFIAYLRAYLNRERYSVRVRANGPRVKHSLARGWGRRGLDQSLPLEYAKEYRVYLDTKRKITEDVEMSWFRKGVMFATIEVGKHAREVYNDCR